MKTIYFLTMLLLPAMVVVSCKDDEEGTSRQLTQTYTYNENIRGSAGVRGELVLSELNLADVIGSDPAKNLTKAELQLASSHLEISGLSQIESTDTVAIVLEDFTIKVGTRPAVNLGDCTTDPQGNNEFGSDMQLSTNQIISLIQNFFTDLTTGSKRARITVSFTPNVDITTTDNLELKIYFGGIYHYVTFD